MPEDLEVGGCTFLRGMPPSGEPVVYCVTAVGNSNIGRSSTSINTMGTAVVSVNLSSSDINLSVCRRNITSPGGIDTIDACV